MTWRLPVSGNLMNIVQYQYTVDNEHITGCNRREIYGCNYIPGPAVLGP